MAAAYDVSTQKVEPRKKRLVEAGFDAAGSRQPVTQAPRRTSTGDEAAHVVARWCRQAPEGQARGT